MINIPTLPKIHHVGIVQPDFESAETFMTTFGYVEDYRGYVDAFECWCIFLKGPANEAAIELVIPTAGPLAKFNKGTGGLHHYAVVTDDIVETQSRLSAEGARMILDAPVKGAGNFLCNFVDPRFTRGLVVEYIQII